MKISILCVGKVKEKFYVQAIDEFTKRLSRYCKLEIIEVADEKTPDSAGDALEDMIRKKEGDRLLKYIKEDAYVIALAIEGKMLSSEELAHKIETLGHWWAGKPYSVSDWRFIGACSGSFKAGSYAFKLFKNDLSSSAYAGDSSGADLQKLQNSM